MRSKFNEKIQGKFLITSVILLSIAFLWMIKPYILTLILAACTAGLTYGFYKRLLRKTRRETLSSVLIVIFVLVLFIVPLVIFSGIVIDQAIQVTNNVAPVIEKQISQMQNQDGSYSMPEWFPEQLRDALAPYQQQIIQRFASFSGVVGQFILAQIAALTKGSLIFFLQLFIFLYALYFFLKDGKTYVKTARKYTPLETENFNSLLEQGISITRATLKGAIFIGILQGSLIGVAFAVIGIQGAAFWGAISILLSIIPSIGSGFVWFPFVIYLFLNGDTGYAIGLLVWGGAIVGSIDNILRPKLVGQDTKMSDLVILVSTLGGLALFGISGFIVGPILAGIVITVWKIYGKTLVEDDDQTEDIIVINENEQLNPLED